MELDSTDGNLFRYDCNITWLFDINKLHFSNKHIAKYVWNANFLLGWRTAWSDQEAL